jgi:hypothetical protein
VNVVAAITASIASKLKEMARSATGGEANALNDMAAKFEQASEDGTTDALKSQGGPPPGPPPSDVAGKVQKYSDQQSSDRDAEMQAFFANVEQVVQSQISGVLA